MTIIWHNPRCSKSRETLALVKQQGIEPQVFEYLKEQLTVETIQEVLELLKIEPADLLRKKEDAFKAMGLEDKLNQPEALIAAMIEQPKLIERPIVIHDGQARLGRPPEQVLEIL